MSPSLVLHHWYTILYIRVPIAYRYLSSELKHIGKARKKKDTKKESPTPLATAAVQLQYTPNPTLPAYRYRNRTSLAHHTTLGRRDAEAAGRTKNRAKKRRSGNARTKRPTRSASSCRWCTTGLEGRHRAVREADERTSFNREPLLLSAHTPTGSGTRARTVGKPVRLRSNKADNNNKHTLHVRTRENQTGATRKSTPTSVSSSACPASSGPFLPCSSAPSPDFGGKTGKEEGTG